MRGRIQRRLAWWLVFACAATWLPACSPPPAQSVAGGGASAPGIPDRLGPRPAIVPPSPHRGSRAVVFTTSAGLTVWWVPRPELPIVSIALAVPYGSAEDPPDQPGLAYITAEMLDEGAGPHSAIGIATTLSDLGTSLSLEVSRDGSRLGLRVLRRHVDRAFDLLGEIAARPRFPADEWQRTAGLWKSYLKARGDDPIAVAAVAGRAALYGRDTPYGHPSRGQLEAVDAIALDDLRRFHQSYWRPDRATLVVTGAIDREELDAAIARAFRHWQRPAAPAPSRQAVLGPTEQRPRLVLVDRPEAAQSVVMLIRPGVAAHHPDAPLLSLLNTALGGAFSSRLNQNLRERHGWTYGVESAFFETRSVGPFVVITPVYQPATGQAVRQMLLEIEGLRQQGLTEAEHLKVRAQDVTRLVRMHETVEGVGWRLSLLAVLGLPFDFDTRASGKRAAATRVRLADLAKRHLDPGAATIVLVGPRAEIVDQIASLELGAPELWSPDGRPLPESQTDASTAAEASEGSGPAATPPADDPPAKTQ